jgi:hypothetical protein
MARPGGGKLVLLAVATVLGASAQARAGLFDFHKAGCPKPSYSPLHYWTPSLCRAGAIIFHHPRESLYAPDRAPGIPARSQVIRYPCPQVDPTMLYPNRYVAPSRVIGADLLVAPSAEPAGK